MCELKNDVLSRKRKILIIDDDLVFNRIIKKHFEQRQYLVDSSQNGIDGMKKAIELIPDLIIVDADLPTITGYELAKKIKNNELLKNIPLMMVSTLTQEVNIHKGLEIGVADFITKPMNIDDLTIRIDSLMKDQ